MSKDSNTSVKVTMGHPWFTLWIFTIAFAHLSFGQGVIGIFIWPYYLGDAIATVVEAR